VACQIARDGFRKEKHEDEKEKRNQLKYACFFMYMTDKACRRKKHETKHDNARGRGKVAHLGKIATEQETKPHWGRRELADSRYTKDSIMPRERTTAAFRRVTRLKRKVGGGS